MTAPVRAESTAAPRGVDRVALRRDVLALWGSEKTHRATYDAHWRELGDYFLPRRARFQTTDRDTRGSKRNDRLINDTPLIAARTLQAGLVAGLTSPSRPWFQLRAPDPTLVDDPEAQGWLHQTAQILRDLLARSNFYLAAQSVYADLGVYGTAAVIQDDDSTGDVVGVRFTPVPIGSYVLATNHRGVVDTFVRELVMSPKQMAQRFGEEALSLASQLALKDPAVANKMRPVLHAVLPNPALRPDRLDVEGMPFVSVYLEQSGLDRDVLSVRGYREFPVMAPRWDVLADDVYGRSPGMDALGDAKALQLIERRKLQILDKITDPPMTAPPDLMALGVTQLPGDVNVTSNPTGLTPSYVVDPRAFQFAGVEVREHEGRVNRTFFVDLFLALTMDQRNQRATAREIEERHEEKLLMLGPVLERLHDEFLNPVIDRTFAIAWRNGAIPAPPASLAGTDARPEYISMLAQAQRAVAVGGLDRIATAVAGVASFAPQVTDKLDVDQWVDEYAQAMGVPPTVVVADAVVAERRAAREQAAQAAQAAAAAPGLATAAQAASQTPVGDSSLLDSILATGGIA